MTEDDKFRIELHRSDVYYGDPLAADRIEQLVEENKELTLQLLAVHGQAADALDRAVVAEAKLAKAVEIGNKMAASIKGNYYIPNVVAEWNAALAELRGGK